MLANASLKKDIAATVYHIKQNEGLGIPRYLLVRDRKIILNDALSPGELEALKKQLVAALKRAG